VTSQAATATVVCKTMQLCVSVVRILLLNESVTITEAKRYNLKKEVTQSVVWFLTLGLRSKKSSYLYGTGYILYPYF
jgi:hypothetical protein